ncbi:RNA polymerase sigma factor [Kordiimonas laminariae]|uniref:RNA polymerase sigma factor n=1 Tax=Kordiimonas laminariae TaxID=2917717 RepID=UPI001FF3E6ED|nr:sigma-70 family RNA polymerase sigma factor [Kordiimonas laminariae]
MQLSEQDIIKVIEANKGLLFKVAHQYCHDRNDREDLVQEMIIAVWKSANRYDPEYKLSTWMTRIAINVAVSHYRKNRKHKEATETIDDHSSIAAPDNFENSEQNHLLKQILQQETPLNRALVILYLEGNNQAEIAEILGISGSNVASKLHRLKTKFAKQHAQEKQTA